MTSGAYLLHFYTCGVVRIVKISKHANSQHVKKTIYFSKNNVIHSHIVYINVLNSIYRTNLLDLFILMISKGHQMLTVCRTFSTLTPAVC